jgi:hypothetical protein
MKEALTIGIKGWFSRKDLDSFSVELESLFVVFIDECFVPKFLLSFNRLLHECWLIP